jgi:tRNA A37 methylthiotransferase MiaB
VPPEEKKRRSREMRGLSEALSRRHRALKLDRSASVLIDKASESHASGYSDDYTRYYLSAGTPGSIVTVRGREIHADGLAADIA